MTGDGGIFAESIEAAGSLEDLATVLRVQHGLQPGQIMPAAFGPRKQAGKKPKR